MIFRKTANNDDLKEGIPKNKDMLNIRQFCLIK